MTNTPSENPAARASRSLVPGVLLVVFGIFFLATNFLGHDFEEVWPATLLIPAVAFLVMFMRDRRQYGLLMPAAILLVLAVLFFVCQMQGWDVMQDLWPIFMFAPGLGFFILFLFGRREPALLIPATILTGLSVIFLLANFGYGHLWPAVLILAGVILLVRHNRTGGAIVPPDAPPPPPAGL